MNKASIVWGLVWIVIAIVVWSSIENSSTDWNQVMPVAMLVVMSYFHTDKKLDQIERKIETLSKK